MPLVASELDLHLDASFARIPYDVIPTTSQSDVRRAWALSLRMRHCPAILRLSSLFMATRVSFASLARIINT